MSKLPDLSLWETERGNILLVCDEEFYLNAWIRLDTNGNWLQIAYRHDNYPSLEVATVTITDKKLADHINNHFDSGWTVRKCNIKGVRLDSSMHIIGNNNK